MCAAMASLFCQYQDLCRFYTMRLEQRNADEPVLLRIKGCYRVRPDSLSSSAVRCSMNARTSSTILRFVITQAVLKRVCTDSGRSIVRRATAPTFRVSVFVESLVSALEVICISAFAGSREGRFLCS